jgi:hypothetical protein
MVLGWCAKAVWNISKAFCCERSVNEAAELLGHSLMVGGAQGDDSWDSDFGYRLSGMKWVVRVRRHGRAGCRGGMKFL